MEVNSSFKTRERSLNLMKEKEKREKREKRERERK